MWAFLTDRLIDWAYLVKYRMHKTLQTNAPLLYPPLVTLFLCHFQIPLGDEPFVQVRRSFAISAGAVTSFGYHKDIDGQWIRKQDLPPPIPDERTLSPLPQRDASSTLMHEVLSELRGLRAFVGDRLDAIDAHFEDMDTRITQLEEDIGFIHRCFDQPPAPQFFLVVLYFSHVFGFYCFSYG